MHKSLTIFFYCSHQPLASNFNFAPTFHCLSRQTSSSKICATLVAAYHRLSCSSHFYVAHLYWFSTWLQFWCSISTLVAFSHLSHHRKTFFSAFFSSFSVAVLKFNVQFGPIFCAYRNSLVFPLNCASQIAQISLPEYNYYYCLYYHSVHKQINSWDPLLVVWDNGLTKCAVNYHVSLL